MDKADSSVTDETISSFRDTQRLKPRVFVHMELLFTLCVCVCGICNMLERLINTLEKCKSGIGYRENMGHG